MKTYFFKHCRVELINDNYLETIFEDGTKCPAAFIVNEENKTLAKELGYGDNVRQMHFEHEIGHTFLSQELGRPYSLVLRRVALKEPWTYNQIRSDEEGIVLAFQKYLNTGETSHWLDNFDDVYGLARVFTACYRGDNGLS